MTPDTPTPPNGDATPAWVDLSSYTPGAYDPGRSAAVRLVWWFVSLALFESGWFLLTRAKPPILRWFGAKVGRNVTIKPHVRIKHPWMLAVGDHVWIGQESWIDNLAPVTIGSHVCVSQRAYLCTGSHDAAKRGFDLVVRPIVLENGAWVGASAVVLGGVTVGANAIVGAGSVANRDVPPGVFAGGVPARVIRDRQPPTA
ncbi:MAG: WcaF family extracellular polysaccharide biosynthesis acetyltransferase [Lacipirellulaceae bacterium]